MNSCPVYRVAGGLSYGSPYMGPIGAVLAPLLWPDGRYADLPFASSLCGRCTEVCPVGIPLHRMLLDLRADAVKGHHGAASVELHPAPKGTGIIAGGPMRAVFEVVGITDIVAKSHGSSNPYNMVRATFDALVNSTTPSNVAAKRGKTVEDIFA